MALKKITYNGSSKVIINLCRMVNQLIDGASSPSASNVSYDNTGSGLSAENVQDAIDEVYGDIPTKTSDLTNDSGFITNTVNNLTNYYLKTETYTQAQVDALISAIATVRFEVVQTLPVSDIQTNVIYLVPSSDPGTQNIYDEYINTTGTSAGWELIGSTQVDLSDYVTTQDLSDALADYVTNTDLTTILADYVKSADLATVATTGDYDDLTNKPTIPAAQVQSDWNQSDSTAVDYIKNKPTIPSGGDTVSWNQIQQSGTKIAEIDINGTSQDVYAPNGGSTYTEGDGIDISQQNEISVDTTFTEASTRANIDSGDTLATIWGKIKKFFSDLKAVAFTGAYADLSGTENVAVKNANNQFSTTQTIDLKNGTTTTVGNSAIVLGNDTAQGNKGNSQGRVRLFGSGSNYTDIDAPNSTSTRHIKIPDASGTLALISINNNFSANQTIDQQDGTTSSSGSSQLVLGNNIPEGTDGNSRGQLQLYSKGTARTLIRAFNATAERIINLPDAGGTVALTSDIPTDFVSKANGGTFGGKILVNQNNGTTETVGESVLAIGNNLAEGVDKNSLGVLHLYSKTGKLARFRASATQTVNRDIYFPDASGTVALTNDIIPASRVSHESVSVTSDGSKTWKQEFDSLWALIDGTKMTPFARMIISGSWGETVYVYFAKSSSNEYSFSETNAENSGIHAEAVVVSQANSSLKIWNVSTLIDRTNQTCPANITFTLYYG